MKNLIKYCFLVLLIFTVACVETITDNPNEAPDIKINSPVTGDSVMVGKNYINYSAADYVGGSGIISYEVVFNGNSANSETFAVEEDDQKPKLYFNIPSTLLGATVSYEVKATNGSGLTGTSGVMSNLFVGPNTNPPEAPDTFMIARLSVSEIQLFWTDMSDTETGFEIFRKDGRNGTYAKIDTAARNADSYTDRHLSNSITYYYKLRSYNSNGASSFTYEISSDDAGGNEPHDVRAEARGATVVKITWKNTLLTGTRIRVRRKHSTSQIYTDNLTENLTAISTEYVDRHNLSANTEYTYQVSVMINGKWFDSAPTFVATYSYDVPVPENVTAEFNPATNHVEVRWGEYPQHSTHTYVERKKGTNGAWVKVEEVSKDQKYVIDENITENDKYFYRAKYYAEDEFYTLFSEEDTVDVPTFLPLAPLNLQISKIEDTAAEYLLQWEVQSSNEDGFNIYLKKQGSSDYNLYTTTMITSSGSSNQAYRVTIPTNDVYYFIIKTVKGSLESVQSNEVSTLGVDGSLVASATYNRAANVVTLNWSGAPAGVISYQIERSFVWPVDYQVVGTVSDAKSSYQDNSVVQSRDYIYRIRAVYNSGDIVSNEITIDTY